MPAPRAPAISARQLWTPLQPERAEQVTLKEVSPISCDLQGSCQQLSFSSIFFSRSLLHCLKPQQTSPSLSANILQPRTSPAVVSSVFLPSLLCLTGPYIACWLDFSNFSIFRRTHTRKKHTGGPIWEDRKIPDGVSCQSFTSVS